MAHYLYGNGRIGEENAITDTWGYHMPDALGSVRQMADASGDVLNTSGYEPFGSVLASAGTNGSQFGFAGEQNAAAGMQYLRARYYAPEMGRFMSRDIWDGDSNRPLSLNKWNYVEGNPINLTDPSGQKPCSLGTRYCMITSGDYEGLTLDMHHWDATRGRSDELIQSLLEAKGEYRIINIKATLARVVPYPRQYYVRIPASVSNTTIHRVGLGITMSFESGLEWIEGSVPRCKLWPIGPRCSAFSNEDLPSAYLGYIASMKGKGLQWIIDQFNGDAEGTNTLPETISGSLGQAYACSQWGICGNNNPFNKCFTPKLLDKITGKYRNVDWPISLQEKPIGQGEYWSTNSNFLLYP